MSPAPGVTVTSQASPPSRSSLTDIGRAFMVGVTQRGPLVAKAVQSVAEKVRIFGGRDTGGYLHDSVETKLRIGGGEVVISRVLGPNPVFATAKLFDASGSADPADVALVFTALEYGEWANGLNVVATIDGSNFVLAITHDTDGLLETSPTLADRAAAVAWAADSAYGRLTLGASNEDPRAQTASAAGGTDDRANITTTQWVEALDRFLPDFGAGQVAAPGITTDAVLDAVRAHAAAAGDRVAFGDYEDTNVVATLLARAADDRAESDARYGAPFGPWAQVPPLLPGAPPRTVPYSAVQMGLEAANAAAGRTAAEPAAGDLGAHPWVLGLTQDPWTEDERAQLNDAGFNVARLHRGAVRTYGYSTLADPNGPDQGWTSLAHARLNMQIVAGAREIGERYMFKLIDGKGFARADFAADLTGFLTELWRKGALYGATAQEAFRVDTSDAVNTPETLNGRKLIAVIAIRPSPHSEFVEIPVYAAPITESLAA
jgi:phage tail sheath protein FI